jgi:hypothetical protein
MHLLNANYMFEIFESHAKTSYFRFTFIFSLLLLNLKLERLSSRRLFLFIKKKVSYKFFYLKFVFSKKSTNIDEIFTVDLTLTTVKILSISVAF